MSAQFTVDVRKTEVMKGVLFDALYKMGINFKVVNIISHVDKKIETNLLPEHLAGLQTRPTRNGLAAHAYIMITPPLPHEFTSEHRALFLELLGSLVFYNQPVNKFLSTSGYSFEPNDTNDTYERLKAQIKNAFAPLADRVEPTKENLIERHRLFKKATIAIRIEYFFWEGEAVSLQNHYLGEGEVWQGMNEDPHSQVS